MTAVERLQRTEDIQAVFTARNRRAGRTLVVHARDRADGAPTRVAVVASRQVGTAVARNRSKRLLREAAQSVGWRAGLDVVLVARGAAAASGMNEVRSDLVEQAGHLGVLQQAAA